MTRRTPLLPLILGALLVVSASTGCKKKPPATTPDLDTSTANAGNGATTDVRPAATPRPDDRTEAPPTLDASSTQKAAEGSGALGEIFFAYDSSVLSADSRERLARNAEFFGKDGKRFSVLVEGHCDERGTNEYNIALGERRAVAARDYLTSLGVPAARLRTISYGEERPGCSESSEGCWQRNRRAYFRLQ